MIIKLPIKPLSVNAAWQGRRFKTKECNQYCKSLLTLLPKNCKICGYIEMRYKFFLKNWKMTDGDNLVKVLTDVIVKAGIIEDDRKILRYVIEKYPADTDSIEIDIREYEKEGK